jgi:hypothetical protein
MNAVRALTIAATMTVVMLASVPARAGCGCQKPPPPLAQIRPAFASPGDELSIFTPDVETGRSYMVMFIGSDGMTVSAAGVATVRRDFADQQYKPQVVLGAPELKPGPARVVVMDMNGMPVVTIGEDQFTVLQAPLALAQVDGVTVAECYSAAVGQDGTLYIPVDIKAISDRMLFSGLGMTYPLLFGSEDIAIYNTQGVLMQLLGAEEAEIFAIQDPYGQPHSFELLYDRHEFNTYRDAHLHEAGYGLDATDPRWHLDGTPHIDHDRLVIAIKGFVEDLGMPVPGATPPFTLDIVTALPNGTSGPISSTTMLWSMDCEAASAGGTTPPPLGP